MINIDDHGFSTFVLVCWMVVCHSVSQHIWGNFSLLDFASQETQKAGSLGMLRRGCCLESELENL